tara:strand:- start:5958 stop:6797 length:840 start_codon:yes stop_codon:yes gene_type:complete
MKLAVVITGWHYPLHFYKKLYNQKTPTGWNIDFFVIGHRDPKFSHNEKNIDNPINLLEELDNKIYNIPTTIEKLQNIGWKYIEGNNGCQWEGSNFWLKNYNYKNYDALLFADDDHYVVNNNLFVDVLTSDTFFINEKIKEGWVSKKTKTQYNEWLVISNSIQPNRQMIRGSFEFFKPDFIELMGGKFPLNDNVKNFSLERKNNKSTPINSYKELDPWNDQCLLFMDFINEKGLYNKVRFLGNNYRVSNYIIEGERGLISNNKCVPYASSYIEGVQKLNL